MVLGFQEEGFGDMPIPHSYSSQIYCEPIRLPHTPTQTTTTYNLRPCKPVNKHAYLFMMELEKHRKAIAISVSALGYNQLKKVQEKDHVLNFNFGNDVFAVLPTGFDESLCYTCLPGVFSSKKDLQICRTCFEESLPNS